MAKVQEARASLLAPSLGRSISDSSNYPPSSYQSPVPKYDYAPGDGYSRDGQLGDAHSRDGYGNVEAGYISPAPGGYHQREGYIAGSPTTPSKASSFKYFPSSKWQWMFVCVVLGQAICGLALECYIFGTFQINIKPSVDLGPNARTVLTYLALFIFGFVYQLFLVYDALRMKNTIQIIGLCIYNVGLLIEASVQFDQIHDAIRFLESMNEEINPEYWRHIQSYIIAVPCVIGLALVLMCFATWKLYHEFAWSIYKDISADLRLKRRFLSYQIYIALLKFDFFFFLAFTVQFLVVVEDTTNTEFYLTIAAMPVTIVLLFLAAYWVRRENVAGMVSIIIVYFGALAYFIFKLVRMYWAPPNRVDDYRPARRSLTTFAVITVLLLLVTIAYAIVCTVNFNKGLKPHIAGLKSKRRAGSVEMNKLYHGEPTLVGGGAGPSRMTID